MTDINEAGEVAVAGDFDKERHYVLAERDRKAITEAIIYGAVDTDWVYRLPGRSGAEGISVVGARQLAALYKGLRHRILFSVEKRGPLWTITNYPTDRREGSVLFQIQPPGTEDVPDFYKVLVEVEDIKTGNSLQDEKTELRVNFDREGKPYDNAHYATIAQAKAARNAVEHILPQDFVRRFVDNALGLKDEAGGKPESRAFAMSAIEEAHRKIAAYAVSYSIAIDTMKLDKLDMATVEGLRMAAGTGIDQFRDALGTLGLVVANTPLPKPPAKKGAPDGGQGGGEGGGDGTGAAGQDGAGGAVTTTKRGGGRGKPKHAGSAELAPAAEDAGSNGGGQTDAGAADAGSSAGPEAQAGDPGPGNDGSQAQADAGGAESEDSGFGEAE